MFDLLLIPVAAAAFSPQPAMPVSYCAEEVARSPSRRWHKEEQRRELNEARQKIEENKKEKEEQEREAREKEIEREENERRKEEENRQREEKENRQAEGGESSRNVIPAGVEWPPEG